MRRQRDYQVEMDAAVHEQWSSGVTATAGVAATGLGKGDLIGKMATDAVELGPVLITAHREELLSQCIGRCQAYRPDIPVGLVQASTNQLRRPITVASAPTLAARLGTIEKQRAILADPAKRGEHNRARARMQAAMLKLPAKPSTLIVDECFPAGTLVGGVPIESIRTGDYVDSWDEVAARPVRRRVVATMRSRPSGLVRVTTDRGDAVCTPGHPFLTLRGWIPAAHLAEDDHVLTSADPVVDMYARRVALLSPGIGRPQGRTVALARVASVQVLEPGRDGMYGGVCPRGAVYNLEVEGTHTYCVGAAGLIVHNCHHASSPGQLRILEWAGAVPPGGWNKDGSATGPKGEAFTPTCRLLGVTATLTRADKRGLGMVFRSVAFDRGTLWAITHGPSPDDPSRTVPVEETADGVGWLVLPLGRVVVTSHMDLNKAKVDAKKHDYQDGELGEMVAQDVEEIVRAWCEHAHIDGEDRLTAAFTPNVESAQALAAAFDEHRCGRHPDGVAAGEVYGTTKTPERQKAYADLARGKIKVLVSVMVITEGWDCVQVSCVLMARPTQLPGLYLQCVGRGLRLSPDTGKTDCLVLDVVGASKTQRLVTLTDLLPGAVYDTTELDLIPCEVCGGYLGTGTKLAAAAEERAIAPCLCPCEGCGEPQNECNCVAEDGVSLRDPDGGRRRLIGPQEYADIDLLGGLDESPCNWLVTPGGVNFLEVGNRLAAVVPLRNKPGLFRAGHASIYAGNPGADLTDRGGVAMAQARAAVEAWAVEQDHYYPRNAPWRRARKAPSEAAQDVARREGIERPERYTAGGLADAIAMARATRRFDRQGL